MPEIYQYSNFLPYLKEALTAERTTQRLDMKDAAMKIGYRSPRSLGMILSGERLPSQQMILNLSQALNLDPNQKRYLELLVQLEKNKRKSRPTSQIENELKKINFGRKEKKVLEPIYFSVISEWYHFIIKQLIAAGGGGMEPASIRQRLRKKLPLEVIQGALQNLSNLGFIKWNKLRKTYEPNSSDITTHFDVPSDAVKRHHHQMMERAQEALVDLPVQLREISSLTFRANPKDIPEIKNMIRKFRNQLENSFEDSASGEVFQLNIQFFPHTELKEPETTNA